MIDRTAAANNEKHGMWAKLATPLESSRWLREPGSAALTPPVRYTKPAYLMVLSGAW